MHIARQRGDYLCAKCGFYGFDLKDTIVQSVNHVECAWFENTEIRVDSDLPDVHTVSVMSFVPAREIEPDWRARQFELGMHQYRFHERIAWHISLDTLPQGRSRNLDVGVGR